MVERLTACPATRRDGSVFALIGKRAPSHPVPATAITGAGEPVHAVGHYSANRKPKEIAMKGIAAYILGVPILVIVLLYVTDIF